MRGRKNKRMLAILAAVVMLVSTCLSGIPAVTSQAADYTVLETDVSTASSGCTMLGVLGTYYADAQNALDRINEIRYEACKEGVQDPRNSSKKLTLDDYVPIKWSTDLESVARIRAMENGLSYYFVGKYHYRMNGKGVFTVSYNGLSSSGEVLAFNYQKGNYVYGINQWYEEKTDWVSQNTGEVTGHYEMMINPAYTYVGLGDFYSSETQYPNILAGEFSKTSKTLDGTYLDGSSDIMQKVEVLDTYIDSYYLDGKNSQAIGTSQTLIPRALLKNNSYERNLYVVDAVTYTSSDNTVATVSSEGVVTAKKTGTVTITASSGGKTLASKTINITGTCNHSYVLQSSTAATCTSQGSKTYKCSACGDTYSGTIEKTAHNYTSKNTASAYLKSAATTNSPAVYYYSCSVCGAKGTETFTSGSALTKDVTVSYKTHIQTYGDTQSVKTNGQMAGTSGEAKRLENIWIKVSGDSNLGIQYTTHCQTYGWLPWSTNGEANGTSGEAKRLEAIKIRLTGADANLYDVYYRVHAQSFGWLAWAKNGEPSGTAGYAKRLEGIQIVVVKKGTSAPGLNYAGVNASQTVHDTRAYVSQSNTAIVIPGSDSTVNVMYKTHVQSYGWQTWKENGEMSGTSGKAKRLEGINIKLSNAPYSGGIRYTTHVQTYGWQGNENNPATWKQDGAMAGTSGEAKRLEAIRIALYGEMAEHYDVYYRVHAQTYGWLGWTKNGAASGTAGYAKRLEGIQIVLVPKGEVAPSNTYMGITSTNALPYLSK